jgi:hypothetical protein
MTGFILMPNATCRAHQPGVSGSWAGTVRRSSAENVVSQVVQRDRVLAGEAVAWPQPDQERGGHVQALGGPAEVKLGGDRHERFQLAQLHGLTVPRAQGPIGETSPPGAGLFGRAEECLSELPLFSRQGPCQPGIAGRLPAT